MRNDFITKKYSFGEINIFLPKEYFSKEDNFSVLYYNATKKVEYKLVETILSLNLNYILVYIVNEKPLEYFTPWFSKALNSKFCDFEGRAEEYIENLTDEVIPMINNEYRTKTGFNNIGIGGYSLGGLISLYTSLKIKRFKYIVLISPSLWFPNFMEYVTENIINTIKCKYFIICGEEEGKNHNNILSNMVKNSIELRNLLLKNNPGNDLSFIWTKGGHHENTLERNILAFNWFKGQM